MTRSALGGCAVSVAPPRCEARIWTQRSAESSQGESRLFPGGLWVALRAPGQPHACPRSGKAASVCVRNRPAGGSELKGKALTKAELFGDHLPGD